MEFRCDERLHFVVKDTPTGKVVETKCKSKRCGAGKGHVVIHKFNYTTGYLIDTVRFRDPKVLFSDTRR